MMKKFTSLFLTLLLAVFTVTPFTAYADTPAEDDATAASDASTSAVSPDSAVPEDETPATGNAAAAIEEPQAALADGGPILLEGLQITIRSQTYTPTMAVDGNTVTYTIDATETQTGMNGDLGTQMFLKFKATRGEAAQAINYNMPSGGYDHENGDWTVTNEGTPVDKGYPINSVAYSIDKTSDDSYYLYSFRFYAGDYENASDRDESDYTDYVICLKKYPRTTVGVFFNSLYVVPHNGDLKKLSGPDFAPMAEGTDYREYVVAQNVSFPYTVRINCVPHYLTVATVDGAYFLKIDKSYTLTAEKPYVELALTPSDSAHTETTLYLPTKWRISVTGKNDSAKPDPNNPSDPNNPNDPANPGTATGIQLNMASKVLKKNKTVTLKASALPASAALGGITWSSSNPKVATVDGGKVKAKKNGNATITARTADGHSAKCKITVSSSKVPVSKVKITKPKSTQLKQGKSLTLKAKVSPANASSKKVTWASSNPAIAKVNSKGKVTALAPGKVKITATSKEGGKKATITLTVKPK